MKSYKLLKYISLIICFLACLTASQALFTLGEASAATYYASPSGGGNGISPSSPFQIADFWSKAKPGDTL